MLQVRKANLSDMPSILDIYAKARIFMAESGNPTQWGTTWPYESDLLEDISLSRLYAVCEGECVRGVFCLIFGDDPTYAVIEDGAWLSDTPYGTIHRIAGQGGGVFAACMAYAKGICDHLRIDTHENNKPMQHLILKHGFSYCGIIWEPDETPRLAYEWLR